MKNVLILAYYFPPAGGPGVQRASKFVKYLKKFDWNPIVLTAPEDSYELMDYSVAKDIDDKTIVKRVGYFNYNKNKNKFLFFKKILNTVLKIPDNKIFWNIKIKKEIDNLIFNNDIHVVYITCPPFSTSLLATYIWEKHKIPVIVDFRDDWSENILLRYLPGYKKLNEILQRRVLKHVNGIITVSSLIEENLINKYRGKWISKVITNGYDREIESFHKNMSKTKRNEFVITYIGHFYKKSNPNNFINAIDRLIKNGSIKKEEIKVVFVGDNKEYLNFREYIQCVGYVEYDKLNKFYEETDFLLLIVGHIKAKQVYTGKVFEYLASGKPILALVPIDGVAADLIRETKTGYVVNEESIEDIEKQLLIMYHQWKQDLIEYNPNTELIKKYSREKLTEELASFFNEIVKKHSQN